LCEVLESQNPVVSRIVLDIRPLRSSLQKQKSAPKTAVFSKKQRSASVFHKKCLRATNNQKKNHVH
jgi:hypothetical protein